MVSVWQSQLDQSDGVMWDISPNSIGNIDISTFPTAYTDYPSFYDFLNGGANSNGHSVNPVTGNPYEVNMVQEATMLAYWLSFGLMVRTLKHHQVIGFQF